MVGPAVPTNTRMVAAIVLVLATMIAAVSLTTHASAAPAERLQQRQVINGEDVAPGEYPHLVAVGYVSSGVTECGGVLIDRDWVLTAAHCLIGEVPTNVRVGLGSPDVREFAQILGVSAIVRNPGFNPSRAFIPPTNDIALLRLSAPADLSDPGIGTIALATSNSSPAYGTDVIVAGWGDTIGSPADESYPPIARKALVTTVECPLSDEFVSNSTQVCADSADGSDGCRGDSGGPLIVAGAHPTLVGLVESGAADGGCGVPGQHAVFQRVSIHLDWILNITQMSMCGGRSVSVDLAAGDVPTAQDDVILGTAGPDVINAGAGDDVVCGLGGRDSIDGADGADLVYAGGGNDRVTGGPGNDTIYGQVGGDTLRGGDGDDRLLGGTGFDTLYGDDGADFLQGSGGDDRLYGGSGNDSLYGKAGADRMWGDDGDDELYGAGGDDEAYGGPGADRMQGAAGRDILNGDAGDDTLYGQGDADELRGGPGADTLYGASGDDRLYGGDGADDLQGASGNDFLFGDVGVDVLYGQAGDDTLDGGPDSDTCIDSAGANLLSNC